ncbi:MAG: GNAT family N-acetyltransferase [Planctomycetota bacterium]
MKSPQEFGDGEIRVIEAQVRRGSEADTRNLMENLPNACYLGGVFIRGCMVGAGAIKRLGVHLSTVAHCSRFPDLKGFSAEIGHFCVDLSHRGRGLAKRLVESLLESCRNTLCATTKEDNQAMQQILEQSGFKPVGKPWASAQSPGKKICLWIEPWKLLYLLKWGRAYDGARKRCPWFVARRLSSQEIRGSLTPGR